jgi:hypothetical protein
MIAAREQWVYLVAPSCQQAACPKIPPDAHFGVTPQQPPTHNVHRYEHRHYRIAAPGISASGSRRDALRAILS